MQKLFFITYSDNKDYIVSKPHLISLAKYSGFFDQCIGYSFKDLDGNFINKYKEVLTMKRGGGYWLWKLNIIEKTLNEMQKDDILIYSDAGSSFNYHAKKRFQEYIEMVNDEKNYPHLRFESESHHIENEWTSRELFDYFGLKEDSKHGSSTQLSGGQMLFKKTDHTLDLLDSFHKVLEFDINLITDYYNDTKQIPQFKECRHDQSIWSLLSKTKGCIKLNNEIEFKGMPDLQYDFPFLAVRRKGHGLRDRIIYKVFKNSKKSKPEYFRN